MKAHWKGRKNKEAILILGCEKEKEGRNIREKRKDGGIKG